MPQYKAPMSCKHRGFVLKILAINRFELDSLVIAYIKPNILAYLSISP